MKLLQALLISSLTISASCHAMQKTSKPSTAKQGATASKPTSQQVAEKTFRSVSNPELAKLINVVLTLQLQNTQLLEGQKSTLEFLKELITSQANLSQELRKTQQTVEEQKAHISQLSALFKSSCCDLIPSFLLDRDTELNQPAEASLHEPLPLVSEFKPSRLRTWTSSLDSPTDDQLLGTPNHPRLPNVPGASNPWLSPNHTKK